LLYLLVLASGGQFVWIWLLMLMSDVNRSERAPIFPTKTVAVCFVIGIVLHFALLFGPGVGGRTISTVYGHWLPALLVLPIILVVSLLTFLVVIARHASMAIGDSFRTCDAILIVTLTILGAVSFIVVQRQVNRLIRTRASVR
jgi:ATP/ADP translocase